MDVQVKNGLAGTWADITDRTKRSLDLALLRNTSCDKITVADEISISRLRFRQPGDVLLGNNQDVGRSLRVDVFEGISAVVFKHFL